MLLPEFRDMKCQLPDRRVRKASPSRESPPGISLKWTHVTFSPVALVLVDEELQHLEHPRDAHDEEELETRDQPAEGNHR